MSESQDTAPETNRGTSGGDDSATRGRILVVDDDASLSEMLSLVLRQEGFESRLVDRGDDALAAFHDYKPDLVLLDLMLPGKDGIDVCKEIRAESGLPIVMLTAKGDTIDVVLGLESGADDYIVKPFKPKELIARIRARIRRLEPPGTEVLHVKDLTIDVAGHRVSRVIDGPVEVPDDPAADHGWLAEWKTADAERARELDAFLAARPGLTPHEVAGAVAQALPPRGLLFVGASNPVRDLDLMVPRYDVGDRRLVIGNRGLAGIDGSVSTAVGAALGRPSTTRAFALLGDVTFLHDSNGLVLGPHEPRPDLTLVVVNDDGGSIFASLEQGAPAYADSFERLFGTPHHIDLASLCAATRTPHWQVDNLPELRHALANPAGGVEVVEAVVRRDDRRELDAAIRALP